MFEGLKQFHQYGKKGRQIWFRLMKWAKVGVKFYEKSQGQYFNAQKIILKQPPTQEFGE